MSFAKSYVIIPKTQLALHPSNSQRPSLPDSLSPILWNTAFISPGCLHSKSHGIRLKGNRAGIRLCVCSAGSWQLSMESARKWLLRQCFAWLVYASSNTKVILELINISEPASTKMAVMDWLCKMHFSADLSAKNNIRWHSHMVSMKPVHFLLENPFSSALSHQLIFPANLLKYNQGHMVYIHLAESSRY